MVRLVFLLLAALLASCATSGSAEKTPEQKALEDRYDRANQERSQIEGQKRQIFDSNVRLFQKAGSLEKKKKLASGSMAMAEGGKGKVKKGGVLGPVTFKRKSASFVIQEKGPGAGGDPILFPLDVKKR